MRHLLSILLLFLFATPAVAQSKTSAERYEYEVHWGYADVARVTLQRGCPRKGYVPAKLSAKSLGVVNQVHEFEIVLDSFVNRGGRSLEGRTFIEEEGVPRRYKTRFSESGSALAQKTYKKQKSQLRLDLRPGTHDLLSWFFALRATQLVTGHTDVFYVWDGWKLTRLNTRVGKVAHVWTPSGTFRAYPIALTRVRLHHARDKAYQPKAKVENIGTVWLQPDAARTPVAMDFRAPVGLAKLRLLRRKSKTCR